MLSSLCHLCLKEFWETLCTLVGNHCPLAKPKPNLTLVGRIQEFIYLFFLSHCKIGCFPHLRSFLRA